MWPRQAWGQKSVTTIPCWLSLYKYPSIISTDTISEIAKFVGQSRQCNNYNKKYHILQKKSFSAVIPDCLGQKQRSCKLSEISLEVWHCCPNAIHRPGVSPYYRWPGNLTWTKRNASLGAWVTLVETRSIWIAKRARKLLIMRSAILKKRRCLDWRRSMICRGRSCGVRCIKCQVSKIHLLSDNAYPNIETCSSILKMQFTQEFIFAYC